ncbi:hypothetical protein MTO98_09760 [Mucilaginibacter sp. SMC90]|uniref:hypothetical protein n=1 Tax=Mucilaginibacter sp. SMC90 TaxID=2929803 RepID=UPI001FB2BB5C|nr:hypothetical protein [Mucilaginibacter sp. SMC90]UOE51363.1 hypothetical protein MTO98_09760 [Mucilaginibacter sp. SMC90]
MKGKQIKGYGNQIPPDKNIVVIWFIEKGSNEITALAFYRSYQVKQWRNKRGNVIKDWKMRAWQWLWEKV